MTRAVAYLRVSTEGQVEAWGLDAQRHAVEVYAAAQSIEVVAVVTDNAISGRSPVEDRPGLLEAISMLRDNDADLLLVARLDRIARDLTVQEAVLAEVWRLDAEVHTCDLGPVLRDDPDDPMRTAIRQVMGAFAQLDRAMLVKRLRDGRAAKARAGGKPSGRYSYGHSKDGPVEDELHVIETVRALRATGMTWDAVTAEVNSRGARWHARTGRPWTRQNLACVLTPAATDVLSAAPDNLTLPPKETY